MDAQDFINGKDFELSDDIVLKEMDPKTVDSVIGTNIKFGEFVTSESLSNLSEASAISDDSEGARYPSYQALNEAAQAVGGRMPTTSAVASTVNNALGIQSPSLEFLGQTAKFAEDTSFDLTEETAEQIREAQRIWATGTMALANTSEKANGGFKFSTSGTWDVGANAITVNSDGTMHWNSPTISSVAGNHLQQSKAHFVTTDLKKTDAKNKYEHIEKTSTSIKTDAMSVTINTDTEVSNAKNVKAVEKHRVTTAKSMVDASELIDHNSQQDARITARRALHQQSSAISITSAKGSKVPDTNPGLTPGLEGESVVNEDGTSDLVVKDAAGNLTTFKNVDDSAGALATPGWQRRGNGGLEGRQPGANSPATNREGEGSISITADAGMTMIAQDSVMSSQASQVFLSGANTVMSAQGGLSQIAKSFAVSAESALQLISKGAVIASSGGSSFIVNGGQTFIGQKKIGLTPLPSLSQTKPIKVRKVPKLPDLPRGITYDDLEKCIPDKFKTQTEEVDENTPDNTNAPTAKDAGQREKQQPIPTGKESGAISESNVGEGNADSNITEGAEAEIKSTKLPNVSPLSEDSSPTNPSNVSTPDRVVGAAGVIEGGVDIFLPEQLGAEEDEYNRQGREDNAPDLDNAEERPIDITSGISADPRSQPEEYNKQVQDVVTKFTNGLAKVNNKYIDKIAEELSVYSQVSNLTKELLNSDSNTLVKYFEDRVLRQIEEPEIGERLQNILTLPGGKDLINKIVGDIQINLIEGGLIQFVSSAYKHVNEGINVVSSTIDDIANSEVGRITKTAREYADFLPGQAGEVFNTALDRVDSVLNADIHAGIEYLTQNSASLNNIYKTLQNVIQNKEFGYEVLDNLASNRLRVVIRDQILNKTSIGLENIGSNTTLNEEKVGSAVDIFVNALLQIKDDDDWIESGFSQDVINRAIDRVYSGSLRLGEELIEDIIQTVQPIVSDVLNTNIEELVSGSTLENILPYVVGPQNAALFKEIKGIYFKGRAIFDEALTIYDDTLKDGKELYQTGEKLYTTLKAVPGMIALMNSYKIPVLNQVKTLLSCFDLLNQFKTLWDDVNSLIDTASKFADPLRDTLTTLDDLFSLFKDNEEDEEGNIKDTEADLMALITDGIVSGSVAPDSDQAPDISNIQVVLQEGQGREITSNAQVVIPDAGLGTELPAAGEEAISSAACQNIIFSASADTIHNSNDPSEWQDGITNSEIIKIIETLPRLTQIFNSVIEVPDIDKGGEGNPFGNEISAAQIDDIKKTTINIDTDNCFVAPKLNLIEATVDVKEIKNGLMLFKMQNIDLLKFNNKNILPNNNTIIQIYAEEFFNTKSQQSLRVHRSPEFFSPYVYSFKVMEFKASRNIGLAQFIPSQPRIYLRDITGVAFNYGAADIGNKLRPIVKDAYVLL